jgi:hypothetical protein
MAAAKRRKVTDEGLLLQGKEKLLSDILSNIKTFEMKLKFIKEPIEDRNLIHLPSCKSAFGTYVKKKE